MTKEME